eukprot:SAG11_NODE_21106_length_432_cov_0.774775_1_plen_23_part_10
MLSGDPWQCCYVLTMQAERLTHT